MKIPSPEECGLPEKFSKWRANQEECLRVMITNQKRATAISAPTGFGKSAVVMAAALLSKVPTCIVTNSRGLQDQLLCLDPDTPVCTINLRWVRIGDLKVGDGVLGFDEFRTPNRRNWGSSTVLRVEHTQRERLEISLADGSVLVCSPEHSWLTGLSEGHGVFWKNAGNLRVGDSLNKVLDTWEEVQDYATGYLAAAFDGEGHLHQSKNLTNGRDVNLSFAQVDNCMLDTVLSFLSQKGFDYSVSRDNRESINPKHKNCNRVQVGGRRNILRFLGQIRPSRLLEKFDANMMGMLNPTTPVMITQIRRLGVGNLCSIRTTSHTYIASGFASHNCDFKEIGLVDIRGKRNYSCDMRPEYTCEEGHAARCPYKGTVGCPASQAEMRAATSMTVTTNYAKWTAAKKYGMGMQHFKQVIFDEGHSAPDALASAMQVVLNHKEINKDLGIDFLEGTEALEFGNWRAWAQNARVCAEQEMIRAAASITGVSDPKPTWVRHFTHMRNLTRRLATISTANAREWIVDETEDGFQFDPIRPGRYAESALLLRVPKIIIVSATLRPKSLFMIGIGKDNFHFQEFGSDFDPKRCPIYYIPTLRVDKNHTDLRELWVKHDQIAGKRQDRNGIVHTISYARRDDILSSSRFASNMIINQKGEPPAAVIEQFIGRYPGAILVSPSVGTGYDFAGKAAEWQFICKIPFPDSRSKIVQARQHDDPEFGPYTAMQDIVQMAGRPMRSKEDRAETFICDQHLDWFLPRFGHLAPKSFHGFFRKVDTVPPPPERLR